MQRIVIATPHPRYDALEHRVSERLAGCDVVRLRRRDELTVEALRALQPSHVFFPHWSWRIADEIIDACESVIFHMTDVPFGRGGSPLQNLISRGIYDTKLSALRCAREIDAGPVYLKRPLSLEGTAEEIYRRAADLMAEMIVEIVQQKLQPEPQSGTPTVFSRRGPEDGDLRGLDDLRKVYDFIRMLDADGYPPAFIQTEHLRFEFSRAGIDPQSVTAAVRITARKPGEPGK